MTRPEFESAVKDALRHYTQADLLAGNALLHARLITRSTQGAATPQVLRALLAETAKTLFAGERDQRLYRILDLTYLNPAPKQEVAADRLGLHLSPASDRWCRPAHRMALAAGAVGAGVGSGFRGGFCHRGDRRACAAATPVHRDIAVPESVAGS
jgi:hypothetical protein